MNIAKLQSQLQRVPDQALIGYVQNPDGQVPSFLALAELTRRKEMRNSAAPQQAAPTQTVAQQAVAEAQPMPGVAGLPVPEQMFNEESYANGGIVAFADGGETRYTLDKNSLGGKMFGETGVIDQLPPSALAELLSNPGMRQFMGFRGVEEPKYYTASGMGAGNGALSTVGPRVNLNTASGVGMAQGGEVERFQTGGLSQDDIAYHRALENTYNPFELGRRAINYGADILTAPGQLSWMRDPKTGKLVRAYEVEGMMPRTSGFDAAEAKNKKSRLARLDLAEADNITRANLAGKPVSVGATREGINQLVSDATAPQSAVMDRMVDIPIAKQTATKAPPAGSPGAGSPGAGIQTVLASGLTAPKAIEVDESAYNDAMLAKRDAAAEAERFKAMVGENKGLAALQDRLGKMETRAAKEEEQAPWMALARAGLGMAGGRSQFAIQNIAEGAQAGLADYARTRERLTNAEEKRFALQTQMAQAERAEQLAAVKFGTESEQYSDAQNRTTKLQLASAKNAAKIHDASNDLTYQKNKLDEQQGIMAHQDRQAANRIAGMSAGKLSDYETSLSLAQKDPSYYKVIKGADGKEERIFDVAKFNTDYRGYDVKSQGQQLTVLQKQYADPMTPPDQKKLIGQQIQAIMSGGDPTLVSPIQGIAAPRADLFKPIR